MSLFTVDPDSNDVEELMAAVADGLRRWEDGETPPLDLSGGPEGADSLLQQSRRLRFQWNVDGDAVIHSTRPRLGPWVIRFQRAVRRMTWWFLAPILQQIRSFQRSAARILGGLAQDHAALTSSVADLEAEVEQLRRRIAELEEQEQREP